MPVPKQYHDEVEYTVAFTDNIIGAKPYTNSKIERLMK